MSRAELFTFLFDIDGDVLDWNRELVVWMAFVKIVLLCDGEIVGDSEGHIDIEV